MIFLDYKVKRALAPRGKPAIVLKPGALPSSASLTLLISPNTEQFFAVNVRHGSNTQLDFFECLQEWVETGHLSFGDILVMDNASVHVGDTNYEAIDQFLTERGITLQTLPTYSPELNPCELIFARIKNFIKTTGSTVLNENGTSRCLTFEQILEHVLGQYSFEDIMALYNHCANPEYR